MNGDPLWSIFINASLVNNFVLAYFLGICPFLGVSSQLATASRMGAAEFPVQLMRATRWLRELERDVEDRLANVPMLLTWGIHDLMFSRSFMERFRETFRDVRVQRLDAKHYIQEDAPKEIAAAIEIFLGDRAGAASAGAP